MSIHYLFLFFVLNFPVLIFLALIIPVLNFPCSSFCVHLSSCSTFRFPLTTHLVHETNIYAKQSRENVPGGEKTKSKWLEVTISEMWKFLSLLFLTGIIKKSTLSSYWSTDPLLATPFFSSVMSRDRFYSILRYFHFNNNGTRPEDCTDRLYKVRPVYDMLIEKFKTVYTPGEHLSLDEEMLKWRRRLLFKVYNPQKPEKYGMKAHMLCEAKSGYLSACTRNASPP